MRYSKIRTLLLAGCAGVALSPAFALAQSQSQPRMSYDIPAQDLGAALTQFGQQSEREIVFSADLARNKKARAVAGEMTSNQALAMLLGDTGLTYRTSTNGSIIVEASDPQSGSAAGDGAEGTVAALIVTAQKKEEQIQDVPIAISAFTEKSLEEQKIEGGFDLLKAIPNVTFSKNNFSGYNFSIRGIGTKAVSVTTDPGVAVEFNSTALIRNRLFEQEYFDVERVEVLRGPQGTLHGRNATSGVINVISATPNLNEFSGSIKGEVGNYNAKRLVGIVNVPLIDNVLGVRFAGSMTQRDGYGTNLYNNSSADGRDLWSGRVTVGFQPTDRFRADLVWERFREDDNRQRTGKQLCTHDAGLDHLGNVPVQAGSYASLVATQGIFSQGCLPGSLYDDAAYGTPNGFAIPFVASLASPNIGSVGQTSGGDIATALLIGVDPYGNTTQSHDLRAFYSQIPSQYRAQADIVELNAHFDLTDSLTFTSQTAYNKDEIYATQDFNRYTTLPSFTDTASLASTEFRTLMPGGVFCDPQLGCSNTVVGQDLSRAHSTQFSQELRLQSDFDGPLNFSVGANYTRYKTVEDYYVFFNGITLASIVSLNSVFLFGSDAPDRRTISPDCTVAGGAGLDLMCVPIENNPISDIQDYGHNYYLSRNPYKLDSRAIFGEIYWDIAENLKLTGGLRYTDDKKIFTPIPTETALTPRDYPGLADNPIPFLRDIFLGLPTTGLGFGYPAQPDVTQGWQEVTGRIGLDWKPDLSFTDATMLYAFYSRGYKGGGMNPPPPGLNYEAATLQGNVYTPSAPPNFRPEFVNAYELGAKNTMQGGALVLNGDVFFYDYKDYQVSKIVDRSAQNENFDAKVWGVEIESVFAPTRNLQFKASLGYLDTKLADGSASIDTMNRLAGHDDWVIVKPALTLMSNCVIPLSVAQSIMSSPGSRNPDFFAAACPGGSILGGSYRQNAGIFGMPLPNGSYYDPADHPEANYGAGFTSDVSGNELPNSPHWTVTLGAQYSREFLEDWKVTIRADAYWQAQSWARIYELPIDKLHGWYNANLSLWVERPADNLKIEIYVKNLLDETPITDTFTNSDDSALTTNIFTLDPRLIGLSIKKGF